jgi:hypothetical protein
MAGFPDHKPTLTSAAFDCRWQGLSTEEKALGEVVGAIASDFN